MKKNEVKSTATITNVYVTSSPLTENTQFTSQQGAISISSREGFDRKEFETSLKKVSRKTSRPAVEMK